MQIFQEIKKKSERFGSDFGLKFGFNLVHVIYKYIYYWANVACEQKMGFYFRFEAWQTC